MAKINVCYKCTDRKMGCHGSCQKYLDEKKAMDEMLENYKKSKHGAKVADDYVIDRSLKIQRRKRR